MGPALAIVGSGRVVIVTLDAEGVQVPFVIVHAKTFVPTTNPVIVVLGIKEFVITPDPETKVHLPIPPPVAVFAAINALVPTQRV